MEKFVQHSYSRHIRVIGRVSSPIPYSKTLGNRRVHNATSRSMTTEARLCIMYDSDKHLRSASRLLEMLDFKPSPHDHSIGEEKLYSLFSEKHTLSVSLYKDSRTSFLKKSMAPLVALGLKSDSPLVHLSTIDINQNQSEEVPNTNNPTTNDLTTSELLSLYMRRDTYTAFKMRYNKNSPSSREDDNALEVETAKRGIQRCKEIVLPIPANQLLHTDYREVLAHANYNMHRKLPGIYCNNNDPSNSQAPVYRMFPASSPAVVLYVHSLEQMEDFLKANGIQYGILGNQHFNRKRGKNGVFNEREIQILHPSLTSVIDIRLSSNQDVMPYYREGIQAVLEGTIAEVQNARVDSGNDKLIKDSRTLKGDCWGEVKALGKKRIGLSNNDANDTIAKQAYSSYVMQE